MDNINIHFLSKEPNTLPTSLQVAIYMDDSIETIKQKIVTALPPENRLCIEEMYLFSEKQQSYSLHSFEKHYKELTSNGMHTLTVEEVNQIALNLGLGDDDYNEEITSYDEFYNVFYRPYSNDYIMRVSLGLEPKKPTLLFPVNPLDATLEPASTLHSTEQKLLFEFIHEFTDIYVCIFTPEWKDYFPHIKNPEGWNEKRAEYLEKGWKKIQRDSLVHKSLDILYSVSPPPFSVNEYINSFTIYVLPEYTSPSLEIIFKNIHSTQDIPMITYHSPIGTTLRLFCPTKSKTGKLIPLFTKDRILQNLREFKRNRKISGINKLVKRIHHRITMVIPSHAELPFDLFIDFKDNGVITLYSDKITSPLTMETLSAILLKQMQPIVKQLNDYLSVTGFFIPIYDDYLNPFNPLIRVENVSYHLDFQFKAEDAKKIKWKQTVECAQSLFIPISKSNNVIETTYIRISNFKSLNAPGAFVNRRLQELTGQENINTIIIQELMQYFPEYSNPEQARRLFEAKIRENIEEPDLKNIIPGFPTFFEWTERNQFKVSVHSISSLFYLQFIRQYIHSLVFIAQPSQGTLLNEFCKKPDLPTIQNEVSVSRIELTQESGSDDGEESEESDESDESESDESESDDDSNNRKIGESYGGGLDKKKWQKWTLKRLVEQVPKLFKYTPTDNVPGYSRQCQGDLQPVILTPDEKEAIDAMDVNFEPSYKNALEYDKDENNKFFFICPKYWSVSQNRSVSSLEVQQKNYKIITRNDADKLADIPESEEHEYVYKFTPSSKNSSDDLVPEFKKYVNPKGEKLPCCYVVEKKGVSASATSAANSSYISDKPPPLEKHNFGFMPPDLELFFGVSRDKLFVNKKIKNNVPYVLRYGVENNPQHSFIACFSEIYAFYHNIAPAPTIVEFSEIIAKSVRKEQFVRYANASLPFLFPEPESTNNSTNLNMNNSNSTNMNNSNSTNLNMKPFLDYLRDINIRKEEEYLWDFFTHANPQLIPRNINLFILEAVADSFRIVCPSNHTWVEKYNSENDHVILYKSGDFYELLCLFKKGARHDKLIQPIFQIKEGVPSLIANIKEVLAKIQEHQLQCTTAQKSKYKSLSPPSLTTILQEPDFKVHHWIRHWNNRIVGVSVSLEENGKRYYLPCEPTLDYEYTSRKIKSIESFDDYNTYSDAVEFLQKCKDKYGYNTKPVYAIVSGENEIIGIETESTQNVSIVYSGAYSESNNLLERKEGVDERELDMLLYKGKPTKLNSDILLKEKEYKLLRSKIKSKLSTSQSAKTKIVKSKRLEEVVSVLRTLLAEEDVNIEEWMLIKLGESILRNSRIRMYMLEESLEWIEIEYKISKNEIIINETKVQSMDDT